MGAGGFLFVYFLLFCFCFFNPKGKHSRPRDPGMWLPFCSSMRWDFVKVLSKVGLVQEGRPHLWSQAPLSPSFFLLGLRESFGPRVL